MRIAVIGGTGLVGAKVVATLRHRGHEVVVASRRCGVNTLTGEGLSQAITGSRVVIDVTNSPTLDGKAVTDFFGTSSRNLLATEETARVKHHIVLSIVGTDRLLNSAYFRAKLLQEELVQRCLIPHTILRSTQSFDFLRRIPEPQGHSRRGDSARRRSRHRYPCRCAFAHLRAVRTSRFRTNAVQPRNGHWPECRQAYRRVAPRYRTSVQCRAGSRKYVHSSIAEVLMSTRCTHLDAVRTNVPTSPGCEECLRLGETWVHLRVCRTCGHVGCCDDSKNRHARKHFDATAHPIITSMEPGEIWSWCFVDATLVKGLPRLAPDR